jgi:AI-2 transport protein TqsA
MPDSKDNTTLVNVAYSLVIVAAGWFLLQQLASLLRPLMLAVFLAYILLPLHRHLPQGRMPRVAAFVVVAGGSVAVLYGVSLLIYSSLAELSEELPRLTERAQSIYARANAYVTKHLPWLARPSGDGDGIGGPEGQQLRHLTGSVVNATGDVLSEALVVGFYLLFLLLEAHRFPERVRAGFAGERAERILGVAAGVNGAIGRYLNAKAKASLILAAPVTLVLWVCGVKFPLLWGVLTFLCNFIPYLGSIIAVTLPLSFAFLDRYPDWQPFAAAVGVLATHLTVTYVVEPTITSRAVGLSPLVILFSLAFWGQCWGLIGMFLAVPLTVMLKIVLENVSFTRPFAELLGDRLTTEPEPGASAPGEQQSA